MLYWGNIDPRSNTNDSKRLPQTILKKIYIFGFYHLISSDFLACVFEHLIFVELWTKNTVSSSVFAGCYSFKLIMNMENYLEKKVSL